MAENSKIEWLAGGSTWNFIDAINIETGKAGHFCEKIAPECKFCYAEKMNVNTYFGNGIRYAVDQRGRVRITLNERKLNKPLHWRKPRLIFPCSMTDLFGEWVPDSWIDATYDVMEKASQHTFLVLTKRPGRRMKYLQKRYANRKPAPNIWEGTSCGLQKTADEFIPLLLQTPAAVRWVSAEQLLGRIDFTPPKWRGSNINQDYWLQEIDWIVVGGESGPNARPTHPYWAREIRDRCANRKYMGRPWALPFFFKQWGEWVAMERGKPAQSEFKGVREGSVPPERVKWMQPDGRVCPIGEGGYAGDYVREGTLILKVGKKAAGRLLDGKEHNEYPEVRS